MISEKQLELESFQKISHKMLVLAESGGWEKLPELESNRKGVMESFFYPSSFSQKLSPHDSSQVERVVQEVLSINNKISQLAEKQQMSINTRLYGMKKKHNVHSAYLQNK